MSIVAYYCRMSNAQLASCIENPGILQAYSTKDLPGAELIDIDRSWEPIAWLVSPRKRVEQHNNALSLAAMMADSHNDDLTSQLKKGVKKVQEIEEDLALIAIEGRVAVAEERLGLGLDGAFVFTPDRVVELSDALARISLSDLKAKYDPSLMDREHVFPEHWTEEGNDDIDTYVAANFDRLKQFYTHAVSLKQAVIIWFE